MLNGLEPNGEEIAKSTTKLFGIKHAFSSANMLNLKLYEHSLIFLAKQAVKKFVLIQAIAELTLLITSNDTTTLMGTVMPIEGWLVYSIK